MRGADGAGGARWNRRSVLRAGALAVLAGPALAACTGQATPPPPDPLQRMLTAAVRDADEAEAASSASSDNGPTLAVIAAVRREQATALRREVYRAAGGPPSSGTTPTSATKAPKPPAEATVTARLEQSLTTAQHQAAALLPKLPRYRAGLVGSVAAGCASLAEALNSKPITDESATTAVDDPSGGTPSLTDPTATSGPAAPSASSGEALPADTVTALQNALAAENAALWLYGTASAFVTGSAATELVDAMQSVQNLRDATAARLTAGGATPKPAQPAYVVPVPLTSRSSALAALALAESGATVAWRSVLEHTDDKALRAAALAALIDTAVRQTRWRRLSGRSPASVAMPGTVRS